MIKLRRAAAAAALAALAAAPAGAQDRPTVAVLDFTNSAIGAAHAELAPLEGGISDLLAGELAASGQVRLVERKAVRRLLDEQALVAGQQVDVATAIRVGKLLGAQHVILGGFVTDRSGQMQLHARAVNMETGVIEHVERVSDRTENFMPLVARLAKQLNAGMRLAPAPVRAEAAPSGGAPARETAAAPPKGAPFQAVLLYSRAVNAEDAGDRDTAVELYSQTLTRFPSTRRRAARSTASGRRPATRAERGRVTGRGRRTSYVRRPRRSFRPSLVKPLVIAPTPHVARSLRLGRRSADVEARLVSVLPAADGLDDERPTVVLLDAALLARTDDAAGRLHALAGTCALVWCAGPGETAPPPGVPAELLTSFLPACAPPETAAVLLRGAMRHAAALRAERRARRQAEERLHETGELARVGAALGTERDLVALLRLVLEQARRMTSADAGSLYLVEEGDAAAGRGRALRFMLTQNDTLPDLALDQFTIPVDRTSLAGYAADADAVLAIDDVYRPDAGCAYRVNSSFDERFGYRTRSVLVIPLKTHKGDIVGVLQLINRKRDARARLVDAAAVEREVLAFDRRCTELVQGLAAQAAVAIENSRLYESIERLFEGFVTASVTAIESRDPATSGHSARVATMTTGLAEALERGGTGAWRGVRFTREQLRELRYAALLHDFGKVAVREEVLVKDKKLYPEELDRIRQRLVAEMHAEELRYERARAEYLLARGRARFAAAAPRLAAVRDRRVAHVQRLLRAVETANEPTVVSETVSEELARLAAKSVGGRPLLRDDELCALSLQRGTLTADERGEIEAHVTHTFRFLSQIPWTPELRDVAEIAYGHHEKLNGLGYPRGLTAERLPVQVRMLTVADIFDALTATDRPYKPAVSPERAIAILDREAAAGEVDADLLRTFVDAGVWRLADPSAAR